MRICCVKIGSGTYAVESQWIEQVTTLSGHSLRRLPNAASYVRGVTVVAGSVLPVVDLALFVGSQPVVLDKRTPQPLLVSKVSVGRVAIVVSSLEGERTLTEPLKPLTAQLRTWERLLLGVTEDGLGVINLAKLLSNQGLLLAQDY